MPQTRSAKTSKISATEAAPSTNSAPKHALPPSTNTCPRLLVLPKQAKPDARIVTLPNPRHGQPARYLVCPETGIYEFIRITAPSTTPRSWLIEPGTQNVDPQVIMEPDLFVATLIDPLFLVLPALAGQAASRAEDKKRRLFLSSDDHLEKLPEESSHLAEMLRWPQTRALLESRMAAICDTVEAGDEVMFRLNQDKIAPIILEKAQRMSKDGLPPSMEEKFVTRTLEAPLSLKPSAEPDQSQPSNENECSKLTPDTPTGDSQSAADTSAVVTSISQSREAASSQAPDADSVEGALKAPLQIVQLQRLRVALDFICSSYVLPSIVDKVWQLLREAQLVDFAPLDEYLAKIAQLRSEAFAASSMADYSRKRVCDDEEEESRADKKRKQDEEKKRKMAESRGVKELKKVNIAGMKKMSDFFKAKGQ